MKIKIFLVLIVWMTSYSADAQEHKGYWGIEAAFTASFFNQNQAPYPDPSIVENFDKGVRPGFELGLTRVHDMRDNFRVYTGLLYTERGGGYKTKNPGFEYVNSNGTSRDAENFLRYRLAYMEVPVGIGFDLYQIFGEKKTNQLNLYIGVSGMLNVASRLRFNQFNGGSDPKEEWDSIKIDGANSFLLSGHFSLEYAMDGVFRLYLKYNRSLTDPYDESSSNFQAIKVDMNTLSIGMGWWFK